ncbi:acetyltransferase [Bdellovibrio bacteriovorus]|uniref:acetyltransferase n=1 Tax=Bdellovibrio bacteriovorus TaxID=959 RepID=UPI003D094F55
MKKIVIFGCGGHAKVVADVIRAHSTYTIAAFFDNSPKNSEFLGYPIFSDLQKLKVYAKNEQINYAVVAIGNNAARNKLHNEAQELGFIMPTLIHPSSIISSSTNIGAGTVIMPGAIINANATIHEGCIVNTGAIVEHDCVVGSFTHIAPGTVLCGGVSIGEMSLVGARTVVIPTMNIGSNVVIGAGSVVVRSVSDNICVIGNPAKLKK